MIKSVFTKLLSVFLSAVMTFTTLAVAAHAADENSGKYVKDVFVAYGEERAEAETWLKNNGWEPVCDLNDGKSSTAPGKHNAVAVLGIKRTSDPKEAITDMATMYMKGGYSFDDYENLVKQKKADIEEFINTFVPALEEYRMNYTAQYRNGGKKRAQAAHDLLNKFFDGDPNGDYAVNDTGKPLGDLLLNKTKTELGDDAYNALSAEQKSNTADLQQIILESSGPAVLLIEQTLALATDTSKTTWLERLDGLTGDDLVDRIEDFAPEAAGQDIAPSAAMSLLAAHFEDYSRILAEEWFDLHDDILWYEEYCEENDLVFDEDDDSSGEKLKEYFDALREEDETRYNNEFNRYYRVQSFYDVLQDTAYSGEWGETLYDFFRPEDEDADYSEEFDFFAPIAAALSPGQRAALKFISLTSLIRMGISNDYVMEADFPDINDVFKNSNGENLESISIYSGINRAIFRKGVALTSQTLMQKSMGRDPYEAIWDEFGIADIIAYSSMALGTVTMITGAGLMVAAKSIEAAQVVQATQATNILDDIDAFNSIIDSMDALENGQTVASQGGEAVIASRGADVNKAVNSTSAFGTAGKWMMGIGGALMILAAVLKGVQLYQYYHRTFTQIPTMIVDEADIVSYTKNKKGEKVKVITFDQFAYYEAVKCNRQKIGLHTNAQNGVSDYESWGCGDAADINADVGKQWLALYVNRSEKKGDPILADSLTLKTGKDSEKTPNGYNGCLHMFMEENPVKIDNEEFCYRSDNGGMYLYWKGDASAFTASAFGTGGVIAISGVGGLALGILGTSLVLGRKKKEQEEPAA